MKLFQNKINKRKTPIYSISCYQRVGNTSKCSACVALWAGLCGMIICTVMLRRGGVEESGKGKVPNEAISACFLWHFVLDLYLCPRNSLVWCCIRYLHFVNNQKGPFGSVKSCSTHFYLGSGRQGGSWSLNSKIEGLQTSTPCRNIRMIAVEERTTCEKWIRNRKSRKRWSRKGDSNPFHCQVVFSDWVFVQLRHACIEGIVVSQNKK